VHSRRALRFKNSNLGFEIRNLLPMHVSLLSKTLDRAHQSVLLNFESGKSEKHVAQGWGGHENYLAWLMAT
jgi:hypothetical protein